MTENDIKKLVKPRKFIEAWFKELPNHKTYEAAYEHIESLYESFFGHRRYSDYNSFRNVKNRMKRQ